MYYTNIKNAINISTQNDKHPIQNRKPRHHSKYKTQV